MRQAIRCFLTACALATLAACTAPPSSSASAGAASPGAPQAATPAAPEKPRPQTGGPLPAERMAAKIDRSCRADADCAVKDVRNCCGAMPACVNVDAKIDPARVQEDCKRGGGFAVCGFPAIEGCKCAGGQCVALTKPIDPSIDPAPAPPEKQ